MKYYIISLLIIVILSVVLYFLLNKSNNKDNFSPSIPRNIRIQQQNVQIPENLGEIISRQPGPLTNITITGSNQGRFLTISVNKDGIISFVEETTLIVPNNDNNPINNQNTRTILAVSSYYGEDGNFFVQKSIKVGNNLPVVKKSCYDLSKGPLPRPHIFSLNTVLQESGYTFADVYGEEGSIQFTEFNKIFNKDVRNLRRRGINLLSTVKDLFETPFFNFFGKVDRLYKPDRSINNRFLGLENIRVGPYRLLAPSFRIEGITCSSSYTYNETKKDGQVVEKTVEFKPFEQKKFKKFNPRDYDYDNYNVGDYIIVTDPVQGIDFDNLRSKFENIPNFDKFVDNYDINQLDDKLPRPRKYGNFDYYPVPTNKNLIKGEIGGVVRGPNKAGIDLQKYLEKKYNLCRRDLDFILQPYNQYGNACPDSQDICLSEYSYRPARNCDWAKVGDAWCTYEEMAGDKLVISEWGNLYHGTSTTPRVNAIMFVFSGTDDSSDIWSDVSFISTAVPRIGVSIHSGFYDEFLKWFPKIMKYIKAERENPNVIEVGTEPSFRVKYNTPYKKIIFGGHSLGGAQAQIAAAYFRNLLPMTVDIEVFSQGSPYPFAWSGSPLNAHRITHSKRLVGYFFDECIFNPTRADPVADALCHPVLGFYCHQKSETPLSEYISREWGGNPFTGGWTRCEYDGTDYRNWKPPTSLLAFFNDLGLSIASLGLTALIENAISLIEHPNARYYQKSIRLCPNSNDPNDNKLEVFCQTLREADEQSPLSWDLKIILETICQ
jgi:hypothetical protein